MTAFGDHAAPEQAPCPEAGNRDGADPGFRPGDPPGTRTTFLHALRDALGATPTLPHATDLGSTATILATVRAGGGVGVVSARATASAVQAGELVELQVDDLDLRRDLHALWQGRRPGPLAADLLSIAEREAGTRTRPGPTAGQ